MQKSRRIVVIPARGGSKGIPNKNLELVGSSSLVARAVQAGLATGARVFVSSDSDKIIEEAERCGATAIARPSHLSGDHASSESAVLHALTKIKHSENDPVALVQATAPFLAPSELSQGFELIERGLTDCAFGAVQTHSFHWMFSRGKWSPLGHPENERPRRQEREPLAAESGSFYAFKAGQFQNSRFRFHGIATPVFSDPRLAIDIDEPKDLEMARELERSVFMEKNSSKLSAVKLVIYDFDGVHTNNLAVVDQAGSEAVTVSRADGLGVSMIRSMGIQQVIVSSETNSVVEARANKLGVESLTGVSDKGPAVEKLLGRLGVSFDEVCYVGNDINDLPARQHVKWFIAVSDSAPEALRVADLVLYSRGGAGAVRELASLLSKSKEE